VFNFAFCSPKKIMDLALGVVKQPGIEIGIYSCKYKILITLEELLSGASPNGVQGLQSFVIISIGCADGAIV
jgi:hypothetical protein